LQPNDNLVATSSAKVDHSQETASFLQGQDTTPIPTPDLKNSLVMLDGPLYSPRNFDSPRETSNSYVDQIPSLGETNPENTLPSVGTDAGLLTDDAIRAFALPASERSVGQQALVDRLLSERDLTDVGQPTTEFGSANISSALPADEISSYNEVPDDKESTTSHGAGSDYRGYASSTSLSSEGLTTQPVPSDSSAVEGVGSPAIPADYSTLSDVPSNSGLKPVPSDYSALEGVGPQAMPADYSALSDVPSNSGLNPVPADYSALSDVPSNTTSTLAMPADVSNLSDVPSDEASTRSIPPASVSRGSMSDEDAYESGHHFVPNAVAPTDVIPALASHSPATSTIPEEEVEEHDGGSNYSRTSQDRGLGKDGKKPKKSHALFDKTVGKLQTGVGKLLHSEPMVEHGHERVAAGAAELNLARETAKKQE